MSVVGNSEQQTYSIVKGEKVLTRIQYQTARAGKIEGADCNNECTRHLLKS